MRAAEGTNRLPTSCAGDNEYTPISVYIREESLSATFSEAAASWEQLSVTFTIFGNGKQYAIVNISFSLILVPMYILCSLP